MFILLGGTGYVGSEFQRQLRKRELPFRNIRRAELDYYDPAQLTQLLRETKAEFLINCAGYTGKPNVDACEKDKTECLRGNAILPGVLRQACEDAGVPWGHVSSGCIFTGSYPNGSGFRETDAPNFSFRTNNCSFYSGTKALGEEILSDCESVYVWRLRIPFNEVDSPRNYLSKLLNYSCLLNARNSLSQLEEFVNASLECWLRRVPFGIYNLTNTGSIMALEITEMIRKFVPAYSEREFRFFESEETFMKLAAKTPRSNCVLDNSKILSTGIWMSDIHDAVENALRAWKAPIEPQKAPKAPQPTKAVVG